MASISANGSRGHHRFTLNVIETSTNTSTNTSIVHFELVLSPIQAYWDWAINGVNYGISIDGQNFSGSIPNYDGVSTVVIRSGDITIGHNDNGDKTIGFSFSISDNANKTYTPGSCSASGSMALTHINRWAIVTGANDFNDEGIPTMTFSNPAGYPMNAWLEINPTNTHLCVRNNIPNTGSYTWELTENERNDLRAACTGNSAVVRFGIYSTIGGNQYASYIDKTFTIINGNPVFENFTYQDTNSSITAITGDNQVLVKGLSTLQATISVANKMTAIKEAIEKNYVAIIGNVNQSQDYDDENDVVFNLGTINTNGTQRLNIRAYDSRNNSTLVYKDITVYDYAKPIINFTAERLNNFEEQTTLSVNGSFSSLIINDIEKNTIQTIQYRYKEKDSQTWGNWANMSFTITNNEYQCTDVVVALDNTKEFDFEVKVTDNLDNNSAFSSIDVGKSIFFISSNEKKCYINDKRVLTTEDKYIDYSIGEQQIGIWKDGKPLYTDVIDFTTSSSIGTFEKISGINYIKHLIDYHGYQEGNVIQEFAIPFTGVDTNNWQTRSIWLYVNQNDNCLYEAHSHSAQSDKNTTMVIVYTKASDYNASL